MIEKALAPRVASSTANTMPTMTRTATRGLVRIQEDPCGSRGAGDGARTRSLNLGKVAVRFRIQACPMNVTGRLSTPIFERDHEAFVGRHRPINSSEQRLTREHL